MTGPWQRPKSGMWYLRRVTPKDLWERREEAKALGIEIRHEVQHSLRTRDKREAERRYLNEARKMEAMWDAWRVLLHSAPIAFTEKQQKALAAEYAKAIIAANEDNPSAAPNPLPPIVPTLEDEDAAKAALAQLTSEEQVGLRQGLIDYLSLKDGEQRTALGIKLLQEYPAFSSYVAPAFKATLEANYGGDSDKALAAMGLKASLDSRPSLNLEMAIYKGIAHRGIRAMQGGDYSPIRALEVAPKFEAPSPSQAAKRVTFEDIIREKERLAPLRLSGSSVTPATLRKYRGITGRFAAFRQSDEASSVTLDEMERWRDELHGRGLTLKTIRDSMAAIRAVLGWGQRQQKGELFPNDAPLAYLDLPKLEPSDKDKSYTDHQAAKVLLAARSMPADHAFRWLPWLLAYSGLRIGEAEQLERNDFFQAKGFWFAHIRIGGGRSTKTNRARKVPIHPDLIAEGLIDYIQRCPEGPVFRGNSLQPRFSEWVKRHALPDERERPAPAHGFRHYWEAKRVGHIEERAALYIAGRSSRTSADDYQTGDAKLPALAEQMTKFPSILNLICADERDNHE